MDVMVELAAAKGRPAEGVVGIEKDSLHVHPPSRDLMTAVPFVTKRLDGSAASTA
jgi:hypothetical protein